MATKKNQFKNLVNSYSISKVEYQEREQFQETNHFFLIFFGNKIKK